MTCFKCENLLDSFNKKSEALKNKAIEQGLKINSQWQVNLFNCFHAVNAQEEIKKGNGMFSEVGACVNNNPLIWKVRIGSGQVDEEIYLQK